MILFANVIMTNHVHAIIQSDTDDLSGLVRDFKKYTSKRILHGGKYQCCRKQKGMVRNDFQIPC